MLSQPAVPETVPVCPDHTDAPAMGACERCGRFLCQQCAQPRVGVCAPCHARQLRSLPRTRGWAKWTRGLLYAVIAVAALTELLHLWHYVNLENNFTTSQENAETFYTLHAWLSLASSIVSLVMPISFLRWLYLSLKVARAIGVRTETPFWAMLAWFVPLYNLVKPYAVVRDLWLNLGGAPSRKALIIGWWVVLILRNGTTNASSSVFDRVESVSALLPVALIGGMMAEAINVLAAVLCIPVVGGIESMLASRREDLNAIAAQTDAPARA